MPTAEILARVIDYARLTREHVVLLHPADFVDLQVNTGRLNEAIDSENPTATRDFTIRGIVIQPSPTQMRGSVGIIARDDFPIPAAGPDARALVANMRVLEETFNENFRRFADVLAGGGGGGRGVSSSPNMGTAFLTHTGRVTTQPSRPGERNIGRVVDATPSRAPIIAASTQRPVETPQDLWSLVSEDW